MFERVFKNGSKKVISVLLTLIMVIGLLPVSIFAATTGDYAGASSVSAVLGKPEEFTGLQLIRNGEGDPVKTVIGDVQCQRTDKASGKIFMYFDIDDTFIYDANTPVEVEVEYYDEGTGKFGISYKNSVGDVGIPVQLTETNTWKKVSFTITDGIFQNNMNSNTDIRIGLWYPGGSENSYDIHVRSVTVKKNIDYSNGVSAMLGDPEQFNGLRLMRMGDGDPVEAVMGGVDCQRTDRASGKIFMYFDIDDSFINDTGSNVEIEVEYYDDNPGLFGIGYMSSGLPTGSEAVSLTGSNQWLKKKFSITNADLNNGLNNADFRVGLWSPRFDGLAETNKDIHVRSVTVRTLPANPSDLLKVSVSSEKHGNIFTQDEQLVLDINVNNTTKTSQNLRLDYSVLDEKGSSIRSGTLNDITVTATSTRAISLDFNDIKKYGVYNLELQITSTSNSEMTVNGLYPFSRVLSENRDVSEGIFGVCTHFAQGKGSIPLNLTAAEQAGAKFIRDEMYWSNAETVKGELRILPSWEEYVNTALAKGMKPLVVLSYGNGLYSGGATPTSQEDIAAFARYAKFIAQHFKGRVTHFEIWNEYNINDICGRGPVKDGASYKLLLEACYNAIKEVYAGNEDDVVVIGGVTGEIDLPWFTELLNAGGYDFMDAISVHAYSYPFSPETSMLYEDIIKLDNLVKQGGRAHKPIWLTETGWPTNISARGVSEYKSAVYGVKAYVMASAVNLLDKVFWYDFQDDGMDENYTEHKFGLIKNWNDVVPGAAKKNYIAYSALTSKLLGMKYKGSHNDLDQSLKIYRFTPADSSSRASDKLVLWTTGAQRNVALNLGCSSVDVSDMYGNKKTVFAVDGKVNVSLSEEPVYIEGAIDENVQLATSALQLQSSTFNAIKGETIQVTADFNGTVPAEGAKYSVVLPTGWQPVQDVAFTAGAAEKQIAVKLPDNLDTGTYEFDIYALLNDGSIIANAKVSVNIVYPYSVKIIPFPAQKGQWDNWSVRAEITNNIDTGAIGGKIKLLSPTAWASAEDIEFNVAPREPVAIDMPVPGTVDQGLYDIKVNIVMNDGEINNIQRKISFLGAERAKAAPAIDGVIEDSEWMGAMAFNLKDASQVKAIPDWSGEDDLSATGYLKWDSNNLYLVAAVKDDVHYQPNSGGNIWNGDGVQLSIDPKRLSTAKATDWNEIGIALNNDSVINKYRWAAVNGKSTGDFANMNCSIVRNEETKTTIYEAAIPWNDILPEGQTVGIGSDIGFSFLVNDSDGSGRGWIEYMGGIGESKDPAAFGDLVLVGSMGTDATLKDLMVNGVTVSGFAAGTEEYTITLPYGTKTVPVVTAATNDNNAVVSVTTTTGLPGTTTVTVTAEDGKTVKTYKINFHVSDGYTIKLTSAPFKNGASDKWVIKAEIANDRGVTLTGTLTIIAPTDWKIKKDFGFKVAAGSSNIIEIPIHKKIDKGIYEVHVKVILDSGESKEIVEKISF